MSETSVDSSSGATTRATTGPDDNPITVVTAYLSAFYTGDFEQARLFVADDLSFRGPFVQVRGREEFFDSAAGLRSVVRGHRLIRQWCDGPDVCSIYDVDIETPAATGTVQMSEWHTVRDSRIVTATVLFDSAELRALMPQR